MLFLLDFLFARFLFHLLISSIFSYFFSLANPFYSTLFSFEFRLFGQRVLVQYEGRLNTYLVDSVFHDRLGRGPEARPHIRGYSGDPPGHRTGKAGLCVDAQFVKT